MRKRSFAWDGFFFFVISYLNFKLYDAIGGWVNLVSGILFLGMAIVAFLTWLSWYRELKRKAGVE